MTFSTLEQLFTQVRSTQTPALLWYSVPGERIELSGRVLENWVSKTANFMVDECEIEAGDSIIITMTPHWRSVVIALAALRVGAKIVFPGNKSAREAENKPPQAKDAQAVFTFSVEAAEQSEAEYKVLVDRGALSSRYMGSLPDEATDYCAEVRSHGDVYSGLEVPSHQNKAVDGLTYEELIEKVKEEVNISDRSSTYLDVKELSADYLIDVLAHVVVGRGVVLLDPTIDWEETRKNKVLSDERAQ